MSQQVPELLQSLQNGELSDETTEIAKKVYENVNESATAEQRATYLNEEVVKCLLKIVEKQAKIGRTDFQVKNLLGFVIGALYQIVDHHRELVAYFRDSENIQSLLRVLWISGSDNNDHRLDCLRIFLLTIKLFPNDEKVKKLYVEDFPQFMMDFFFDDGDLNASPKNIHKLCEVLLDTLDIKYESHVALIKRIAEPRSLYFYEMLAKQIGTGEPDCPVKRLATLQDPTTPESMFIELIKSKEEVATLKKQVGSLQEELAELKKIVMEGKK